MTLLIGYCEIILYYSHVACVSGREKKPFNNNYYFKYVFQCQENNKFIKWYVKKLSTGHKHNKI